MRLWPSIWEENEPLILEVEFEAERLERKHAEQNRLAARQLQALERARRPSTSSMTGPTIRAVRIPGGRFNRYLALHSQTELGDNRRRQREEIRAGCPPARRE